MKYKAKEFLSDKRNILILLLDLLLSVVITLRILNNRIELIDIKNINIWLFLLVFLFISFIFSHFIFNIKELYNFIYKKRYIISLIVLFILVIGKFHGSSIGMWNTYIDPSDDYSQSTIIGKSRAIRSDEWLVNTPYAFSQQLNDYKYYNDLARAEKTDMFSVIFTPIKDIIILGRPFNIGYLLLGNDYGLSFYWYGRLIALLLVTFEMFMLITNKKKLISLTGAITIAGSAIVMWFYSNYIVDLLISGQLCILLFNAFLQKHNNKQKLIYSILMALSFSWFVLTFYPPWQISLGYVFLMFAIWIFVKNKKETKLSDYKFLLLTLVLVMILLVRYLMLSSEVLKIVMSTVYPGARNELGGGSFLSLFNYPFSLFYSFKDYGNPCEASTVFSLFPIPIIISIIYLFKVKKDDRKLLITLLLIVALVFSCFAIFSIPSILSKLTLLNKVTPGRIIPVICIICCYLMGMTIGTIDIKKKYYNVIFLIISILLSLGIVYLCYKCSMNYSSIKLVVISVIIVSLLIYFYL